ncbi:hypothetical protein J1N35_037859, partial [Gossypium stocksii]
RNELRMPQFPFVKYHAKTNTSNIEEEEDWKEDEKNPEEEEDPEDNDEELKINPG